MHVRQIAIMAFILFEPNVLGHVLTIGACRPNYNRPHILHFGKSKVQLNCNEQNTPLADASPPSTRRCQLRDHTVLEPVQFTCDNQIKLIQYTSHRITCFLSPSNTLLTSHREPRKVLRSNKLHGSLQIKHVLATCCSTSEQLRCT